MVCLASCDKTTPGQLMAAARLNVPTLILSVRLPEQRRLDNGEHVDIEEVFLKAGHLKFGGITFEDLCDMSDRAIASPGVCAGMGTANSMHIVAEALGMTLPGTRRSRQQRSRCGRALASRGERSSRWCSRDLPPRDDHDAGRVRQRGRWPCSRSAARSTASSTCRRSRARPGPTSTSTRCSRITPADRAAVAPCARTAPDTIEEFEDAGGALAVLKQLGDALHRPAPTVTGETMADRVARAVVRDERVIRPLADPRGDHPTDRRSCAAPSPPAAAS